MNHHIIDAEWEDGSFIEDNNARLTQEDANECEIIGNVYKDRHLLES